MYVYTNDGVRTDMKIVDNRALLLRLRNPSQVTTIIPKSKEDKVIPLLIVRFTDGVFVVVLEDKYEKRIGGRHDRNDSHDTETCMYIPMTEFVQI
jgi:hypothetical protein